MNNTCSFNCLRFLSDDDNCLKHRKFKGVVSTVVFVLKTSYSKIEEYLSGFDKLHDVVTQYLPDYIIRLFCDDSAIKNELWKEKINKIKHLPNVQVVYFKCPKFIMNDYPGHYGVFGTLIRMLPMFEDDSLPEYVIPPKNMPVYYSDIDFNSDLFKTAVSMANLALTEDFDFAFCAPAWTFDDRHKLSIPGIPSPIWAGLYISKAKIPISLLNNFLNDCLRKRPYLLNQLEGVFETPKMYGFNPPNKRIVDKVFYYGIDEFFLDWVLRSYLFANTKRTFKIKFVNWYHQIILFLISTLFRSLAFATGNLPDDNLKDKQEDLTNQFNLVKSLLLEILLINPENSKDEYEALKKINNPFELLAFKQKINNFSFYIRFLNEVNQHSTVDKKINKGKKITSITNAIRNICFKMVDQVMNGKIVIQYLVYQRLLECIRFFPEEETGVFRISSFEIGKGKVKEITTTKRFKQKFMTLKKRESTLKKTLKNRK